MCGRNYTDTGLIDLADYRFIPTKNAILLCLILATFPIQAVAQVVPYKGHDFLPRFQNLIFLVDVSDSMMTGYPKGYNKARLALAGQALSLFNGMMPPVPHWQYELNTSLITYGDCRVPTVLSPLCPWERNRYSPFCGCLRKDCGGPWRTAALQDALQAAGGMIAGSSGRTAILVLSDGGSEGECPQTTATALKDCFGDKVEVFGVFFGNMEVGWRNLYEVCKLTGGYARWWEEVENKRQMKDFAWDILVREIVFPYPEVFFRATKADIVPSEAIKLEAAANFLHAVPELHTLC